MPFVAMNSEAHAAHPLHLVLGLLIPRNLQAAEGGQDPGSGSLHVARPSSGTHRRGILLLADFDGPNHVLLLARESDTIVGEDNLLGRSVDGGASIGPLGRHPGGDDVVVVEQRCGRSPVGVRGVDVASDLVPPLGLRGGEHERANAQIFIVDSVLSEEKDELGIALDPFETLFGERRKSHTSVSRGFGWGSRDAKGADEGEITHEVRYKV